MHNFTLSESGLAILHFLFLRVVINKLALSVGGGGKNKGLYCILNILPPAPDYNTYPIK